MNWFKFSVEWERRKQKGILDQPEAAKESVYSWAKWGSEEPGTTWTVEEIEKYFIGGNFSETADDKFAKLRDPQTGLAATTERNRKE